MNHKLHIRERGKKKKKEKKKAKAVVLNREGVGGESEKSDERFQCEPRKQHICVCPWPVVDKSLPPASVPIVRRDSSSIPRPRSPPSAGRVTATTPAPPAQVRGYLEGQEAALSILHFCCQQHHSHRPLLPWET